MVPNNDGVQEPLMMMMMMMMMVISMEVMLMIFMIVDVDCLMIDGCLTNILMIVIFFAWFPDTCHTWWEIFRWTAAFNFWWHAFFGSPNRSKTKHAVINYKPWRVKEHANLKWIKVRGHDKWQDTWYPVWKHQHYQHFKSTPLFWCHCATDHFIFLTRKRRRHDCCS